MATLQAQAQAFKQGLADRLQGKPMIAHDDGNDASLVDAYACGYDPHGEQFTSPAVVAAHGATGKHREGDHTACREPAAQRVRIWRRIRSRAVRIIGPSRHVRGTLS